MRLLYQYERGVVFALGRYSGTRDPGMTWVAPMLQTIRDIAADPSEKIVVFMPSSLEETIGKLVEG